MNLEGRKLILTIAASQIGVKESPAGSNNVIYNTWMYGKEVADDHVKKLFYPWCGAFVSWVFGKSGFPIQHAGMLKGYVGCPYAVAHVSEWGNLVDAGKQQPGDVVFYDWQGDGKWDHTGIFQADNGDGKTFTAIEGNTAHGNDSNGGEVMTRNDRNYHQAIFIRPNVYKD